MSNDIKDKIELLLDSIETSRIYAGATFEALCNDKNHEDAVLFCMIRDSLKVQADTLRDYMFVHEKN